MIAFLVAGTASSVGKTTSTLALMAAFRQRGLAVQPFKCGPDFIDAAHHSVICGRKSRNLDSWMLSEGTIRSIFDSATDDADVAIIEGMMGLFDGTGGGTEEGSSAQIAKRLQLPVVLVLDASKSARSIAAVVKGFELFDPVLRFAGLILNGVSSEKHYSMLTRAITEHSSIPILGRLPRTPAISIPERHLGLHTAAEYAQGSAEEAQNRLASFAALAEEHLNLDLLTQCVYDRHQAGSFKQKTCFLDPEPVRIAIARDLAFSFYYEDNLDLLREQGAEIVEFSPLTDPSLPEGLDALYLGGGYPELYAQTLSENTRLLVEIAAFAAAGKPIYAECGGMIYLAQHLVTREGEMYQLAGVLPLKITMTKKLVHFGYAEVSFQSANLLGAPGTVARGHSFHYSQAEVVAELPATYQVRYSLSGREEIEGYTWKKVLASYVHLHFRSNPLVAASFVREARLARENAAAVLAPTYSSEVQG